MMTDKNYISIQGWMRTKLNLKGNELLVYAIIYGFSQTENQRFTGNLQYLADWCGATKQGIIKNLKSLIEKGLIQKFEIEKNGMKFCEYSCILLNSVEQGVKLSLPNNINISVSNDTEEVLSKDNTTEFFGSAKKKTKKSLYEKCLDLINAFTDDAILREMLVAFLQKCLQNASESNKPFYTNNFVGKLNQLKALSGDNYVQREIVKQSIDFGWSNFYALKGKSSPEKSASAKSVDYTQDELDRLAEQDEERRRNGERIVF